LIDHRKHGEFWARDFHPVDGEPVVGAGVTRIDHIAYAMSDEEHLSWLLYHFALFDVAKPPFSEVVDPLGLVQVQPVESRDGRFRLLLKASAAPRTLAARLAQRYWGAGVQYVSLQTDDIFATADRIATLGGETVPAPSNYYDDLDSKGALSADSVERMQRRNIFYDSDEQGEYFQLFTRAFRKRFFFEIVQRRGYQGYGLANEPIRLAAQARFREYQEDLP
jgi:4-hydroxyphenylpyruvate dioxygenase